MELMFMATSDEICDLSESQSPHLQREKKLVSF